MTRQANSAPATRRLAAPATRRRGRATAGFTLVELLVAVIVLLAMIIAVGRIFSSISRVTSVGEANASFVQSAPAIERQIRSDLAQLSRDGFLVIRSIAVRNDVNRPTPAAVHIPLLDSSLPEDAVLRCDQLLFFANGVESSRSFVGTGAASAAGSGASLATVSRVYLGHAFQAPLGEERTDPAGFSDGTPLVPWAYDPPGEPLLEMVTWPPPGALAGVIRGTQPRAGEWILARQRVLLADDGGSPLFFNSPVRNSTPTIWLADSGGDWAATDPPTLADNALRGSRVDIAATSLADIRSRILFRPDGSPRPWSGAPDDQRTALSDAVFFPRAERLAPSMRREDQALIAPALGHGVSSFAVDWTYEDGVGRQLDINGNVLYPGVWISPSVEHPWFGMDDDVRNVHPLGAPPSEWNIDWGGVFAPLFPAIIERVGMSLPPYAPGKVQVYEACFGFNQTKALDANGNPDVDLGYTPWPTALRITLVVTGGDEDLPRREMQFVVPLPRR